MKYKDCGRILAIATLMSFLTSRGYGEQPMTESKTLENGVTGYYSGSEVDLLIEELTEAAEEAITRAAVEAARAEALALLDREAAALVEARKWREEYGSARRRTVKAAVITGAVCFFGGLAAGAVSVSIIGGKL
jgi:hypothetical protein